MKAFPVSHTFISQRMPLHYVEWGDPAKPAMLMVHGLRDHSRSWDTVARALSQDWHIFAPDLRGHGDSAWTSDGIYTMASYLYDLAELIRIRDIATLTIVGHSFGGLIASRYVALYPEQVRRLILIEGTGLAGGQPAQHEGTPIDQRLRCWIDQRRMLATRAARCYASLEEAAKRMRDENPRLSPELALHLVTYGTKRDEDGQYAWKFDPLVKLYPPSDGTETELLQLLSSIAVPTTLLWGTESFIPDPRVDSRAQALRHLELRIVEGAAHWIHHDRPDIFLAAVRDFV